MTNLFWLTVMSVNFPGFFHVTKNGWQQKSLAIPQEHLCQQFMVISSSGLAIKLRIRAITWVTRVTAPSMWGIDYGLLRTGRETVDGWIWVRVVLRCCVGELPFGQCPPKWHEFTRNFYAIYVGMKQVPKPCGILLSLKNWCNTSPNRTTGQNDINFSSLRNHIVGCFSYPGRDKSLFYLLKSLGCGLMLVQVVFFSEYHGTTRSLSAKFLDFLMLSSTLGHWLRNGQVLVISINNMTSPSDARGVVRRE